MLRDQPHESLVPQARSEPIRAALGSRLTLPSAAPHAVIPIGKMRLRPRVPPNCATRNAARCDVLPFSAASLKGCKRHATVANLHVAAASSTLFCAHAIRVCEVLWLLRAEALEPARRQQSGR